MDPSKSKMAVVIGCFLHVFAVFLFLRGFFPTANPPSPNSVDHRNASDLNSPIVGRTVLLVIDALRADFVFGAARHMPYLQGLMRGQRSISFVARVHSPTVTLPRIKALTSGTIPDFIDVVMNFGASEYLEDNVIEQAFRHGHRIVFYGDDTWIRLFKRQFHRSEGTTSFFVKDFHEVDDNVTRHLESEMALDDWSILVLHYLGLDHIGHVVGPQSELVGPKLREMDHVIQLLDVALSKESESGSSNTSKLPSLLVICGDHGMSDSGGHGGSSHSETTVPLVFISSAFQGPGDGLVLDEVRQIDVAPTMSALLGLPIPKKNLGRLLPGLFDGMDWKRRLHLARLNAAQLKEMTTSIDKSCLKSFEAAERKLADWLQSSSESGDPNEINVLYRDAAVCFSDTVALRRNGYDDYVMLLAIVLHLLTPFYIILQTVSGWELFTSNCVSRWFALILAILFASHCLMCWTSTFCAGEHSCFLCGFSIASIVSMLLAIVFISSAFVVFLSAFLRDRHLTSVAFRETSLKSWLLIGGCVLHAVSFASTSFIEEEHQTWYFLCVTYFLATAIWSKNSTLQESILMVGCAIIFRAARAWNSTGDKWAHLDDAGDFLNLPENKIWLTCIVIAGLLLVVATRAEYHRLPITALLVTTFFVTYLYHAANGTLFTFIICESRVTALWLARLNYAFVLLIIILAILTSADPSERIESVATGWIAVSALLLRPHNVPLLPFWTTTNKLMRFWWGTDTKSPAHEDIVMVVANVWLAQAAFFQQGNANSLARVDLTSGYIGLRTYDPVLVGTLLVVATYAGTVFWLLSLFATIQKRNSEKRCASIGSCFLTLLVVRSLPWCFYTVVVYTQRYHLFVWSVFAPKLLFEGMLSLVYVALTLFALITDVDNR